MIIVKVIVNHFRSQGFNTGLQIYFETQVSVMVK